METFQNTFRVTFKQQGMKERTTLDIVLQNIFSVHTAKEFLWEQKGIHASAIKRLS
jgi:hypothetical protein